MSFALSRTQTIGNTCTRQHLYDLIATAALSGVADVGNANGVALTATSEAPAVPTDGGTFWWDMSKQLLKLPINAVGSSACSIWLSLGPDSWELPVCNTTDQTLALGTVVSYSSDAAAGFYGIEPTVPIVPNADTPRGFLEGMLVSSNARGLCGVLQATCAPGQIVPAVYRGFAYAKVEGMAGLGDTTRGLQAAMSTAATGMLCGNGETTAPEYRPSLVGSIISHPSPAASCVDGTVLPCFLMFPWNAGTYVVNTQNSTI